MSITHVIFDMDGLLLDTERLYDVAIQKICDRFNKTYTYEIKQKIMGKRFDIAMQEIMDTMGIDMQIDDFIAESNTHLDVLFPACNKQPGVMKLVHHLRECDVPMCIATGSSTRGFSIKTTNHQDLVREMEFVVKSDDPEVKQGKPNPDIFNVARSRFSSPPASAEHCLVFEDAVNGVKAAQAAGMKVVMVHDPRLKNVPEADLVLSSIEKFIPEQWGLPPYPQ